VQAAVINRFGGAEALELVQDHPEPQVADNQVLVQVHAAGLNPLDIKTRRGELRWIRGAKFPMVLGNDASGVVVKCGRQVTEFQLGDTVYGMFDPRSTPSWTGFTRSGAYAELAVTRAETLTTKPDRLSHVEAAAIPLACLTAYQALTQRASVQPGSRVLINGASGGVGVYAVQLAKAWGASVTAVCSERTHDVVRRLGADRLVDYRRCDVTQVDGEFDVIYDVAVKSSFSACRHLLADDGVFISNIVGPGSLVGTIAAPLLCAFGARKKNTFAFVRPRGDDLCEVSTLIRRNAIRPVIDRVFPLEEIRAAHAYAEEARRCGKVVVALPAFERSPTIRAA